MPREAEGSVCAVDQCAAHACTTIDLGAGIKIRACLEHMIHLTTVARRSSAAYLAERNAARKASS